jgi:hypothetical protein
LLFAACHPGEHGSTSFQSAPFPVHAALSVTYGYSNGARGLAVDFYQGYVTCDAQPQCDYVGGFLSLAHRGADGGDLPIEGGTYQLVQTIPSDAGSSSTRRCSRRST